MSEYINIIYFNVFIYAFECKIIYIDIDIYIYVYL